MSDTLMTFMGGFLLKLGYILCFIMMIPMVYEKEGDEASGLPHPGGCFIVWFRFSRLSRSHK